MLDVDKLKQRFGDRLFTPRDPEYDAARKVYNAMINRRPAAIARCASAADVTAAVRAAVAADVPLAVRSGGHNAGGLGVVDDGLVVDLGGMRAIRVDAEARVA